MTEPSSGHAPPTTDSLTSRTTGGDPDPQKPRPKSRTADVEPLISDADDEDALICMQTQKQVKAVQLLNGGAYIELDTLANYAEPSEVQALMRVGPIYHLGPERRGFSWSRPNSRHNDDYLISLSLYRRDCPAESWVHGTTEEMAKHAQELGIDHAYVWSLDPDDKNAPGFWDYVRTNTPRHVLIPYEIRTRNALYTLQNILEYGPANDDNELFPFPLPYALRTPFKGTKSLIDIGVEYNDGIYLVIHHSGKVEVAVPLVSNPGTDPANYTAIPVTDEEQDTLAARVADTYTPD